MHHLGSKHEDLVQIPNTHVRNQAWMSMPVTPALERVVLETGRPQDLAVQLAWLVSFRFSVRPGLKTIRRRVTITQHPALGSTCTKTCMLTLMCTYLMTRSHIKQQPNKRTGKEAGCDIICL